MPSSLSNPPPLSNAQLRAEMRRRRRALSAARQARAARQAARRLARLPAYWHSRRIAAFLATDGELDPTPLMMRALAAGKQWFLPVLHPLGHRRLWFAPWRPGKPLRPNLYGILEPCWRPGELVSSRALDLVLLPLVAFDDHCNRMGMGAGYYDRTFAWRMRGGVWRGPLLLGYAHDCQRWPRLAAQPWDVPLDGVVTDGGIQGCSSALRQLNCRGWQRAGERSNGSS